MRFEIINIPYNRTTKTFESDVINKFCLNKKIITSKPEFFMNDKEPVWSIFLQYEVVEPEKAEQKLDLTESQQHKFNKLRKWRKIKAENQGIPPFLIAKNKQFEELVKGEFKTMESLKLIHGFGDKKVASYGKDMLEIINVS